jgi:DsbC/DsbD-like thiol-disulfide interchange protein
MKHMGPLLLSLAMLVCLSCPGWTSSSPWVEMQGGRVRLVTAGAADAAGRLQGALEIELKPGWKTYWRDPGDAGVPPTIDIAASQNVISASLDFPAPERHHDGDFSWAGYAQSVVLPVAFELADANKPAVVSAQVFLGVCETICVPVGAQFTIDPQSDPDNTDDQAVVSVAVASLPAAASDTFGLRTVASTGETLTVEAVVPPGTTVVDVFIAADQGYSFQEPQRSERDGRTFFTLGVAKPESSPATGGLHYTLVTDKGAVSGLLPLF